MLQDGYRKQRVCLNGYRSTVTSGVPQGSVLSLSLIPGQGGGSPPQSVPGSPRGVVGPC